MSSPGKMAVTLPGDCEIRIARFFAAPRSRVFECYVRPQWLMGWLGPEGWDMAICDNDPVAGGRYHWLWRNPQGRELGMHGEYLKVQAPSEILRTEVFEQDPNRNQSIGWLVLENSDGGTLVTTSILFPTGEARDRALASGIEKGMASSFERLELLLLSGRGGQTAA